MEAWHRWAGPHPLTADECRLGKRVGIDLSPHRLRRTWATNLHSNGADLLTLSAALGHTSPQTTKRYVGITDDNLHELSSRLDTDWLLA